MKASASGRLTESSNKPSPWSLRFQAFDLLATPVAVINGRGLGLFVNAALEDTIGLSRRTLQGLHLGEYFSDK